MKKSIKRIPEHIKTTYAKKLKAIQEISKAIVSSLYLDDILEIIVNVTASLMNLKICSLMLLDEEKGELSVRATQAVSKAYKNKPNIKLGKGIAGKVAQENKPLQIINVQKDLHFANRKIALQEKLCSLLSVPICIKRKVIGVINLYTEKPHRFTKSEIDTLSAIANQAAIVIQNAQLAAKNKSIQEEIETRKLVEKAKGILMKQYNLPENEAFKLMQKKSMDSRKPIKKIAEALIISNEIKKS